MGTDDPTVVRDKDRRFLDCLVILARKHGVSPKVPGPRCRCENGPGAGDYWK